MPKKSTDHKPFLELAARMSGEEDYTLYPIDVRIIIAHAKWLTKFLNDKKAAVTARTSHGPKRKPDAEVSAGALKMRAYRDSKKNG